MKRLLLFACFIAVITGCNSYDGQLIGVQDRPSFFQALHMAWFTCQWEVI